jgi:outer membrane protein TolC
VTFLLLSYQLQARAQERHAHIDTTREVLTLDVLLRDLDTSNPSLRAARLEAEALSTKPRQVSALPDPTAGAMYRPFAIGGFDGAAPAQATIEQMIPYPGKLRLAGEAARYNAEMAAHETDEMLLDLAYQVKESYYELYMLQQHEHHLRSFQSRLDDFEKAAASRYEVGAGPQQDILKAQLERNRIARELLEISTMRREQLERLARLVNRPDLILQQEPALERAPLLPAEVVTVEAALESRPELKALEAGVNMADAEVAMARREYLPDFMVGAGIMDMMPDNAGAMPLDNLPKRFGVEFGIVIPLQTGRRDAALKEARIRRKAFEARHEAAQTKIRTELNELRNRLREDEQALTLYGGTLLPQAEVTLEATLSAYTTGRADFLDLLEARRMILEIDMEYEHTYADYLKTHARLERTLGVMPGQPLAGR